MSMAAELADDHGSTITAVVVIEMPAQLPLDAHMLEEEAAGKRTLEDARAIGSLRGRQRSDANGAGEARRGGDRRPGGGGAGRSRRAARAPEERQKPPQGLRSDRRLRSSSTHRAGLWSPRHRFLGEERPAARARSRHRQARSRPAPATGGRCHRGRAGAAGGHEEAADRPAPLERRDGGDAPAEVARAADLRLRPALVGRVRDRGRARRPRRRLARRRAPHPPDLDRDRRAARDRRRSRTARRCSAYETSGGAYVVAKENLGTLPASSLPRRSSPTTSSPSRCPSRPASSRSRRRFPRWLAPRRALRSPARRSRSSTCAACASRGSPSRCRPTRSSPCCSR